MEVPPGMPDYVLPVIEHAAQQFGGGAELAFATRGSRSNVVVVHDANVPYVLKIPKHDPAVTYQESVGEATVLDYANRDRAHSPLDLPQPLHVSSQDENGVWPYLALTYVPGRTYGPTAENYIKETRPEERERVGRLVGEFSLWLASTISVETFMDKIAPLFPPQPYPWQGKLDEWYGVLGQFQDDRFPSLSRAAAMMHQLRMEHFPASFQSDPQRVVHGDIHTDNMTFYRGELRGIIDFGLTWPNRMPDSAGLNVRMGSDTIRGFNTVMHAHGYEAISPGKAEFLEKAHPLTVLLNGLSGHPFAQDYIPDRLAYLPTRFPEMDWSELDELRVLHQVAPVNQYS